MSPFMLKVIGLFLVTAMMGGGAVYVVHVIKKNAILEASIEGYIEEVKGYNVAMGALMDGYQKNDREKEELESLFSRHDFAALAKSKPHLISKRINSATSSMFKSIEQATGNIKTP